MKKANLQILRKLKPSIPRNLRQNLIKPFFKKRQAEIGMVLIFLGLILVPSSFLGYLSWRALENEKIISKQRLQESYRQYAFLAAQEINRELVKIENHWKARINKLLQPPKNPPTKEDFDNFIKNSSLIGSCFYLNAPTRVVYPTGAVVHENRIGPEKAENEAFIQEYEIFNQLKEKGEEQEYQDYNLGGAIRIYRAIMDSVTSPQLRAMALSFIGRATMKEGEWKKAIQIFAQLLQKYPQVRDLNNMYLRFLAQYQIALALDNLDNDDESIETLLQLNNDLLKRSDAISEPQYLYFLEQIQLLATRLITSAKVRNVEQYKKIFNSLAEQSKKRISQNYFLDLLDRKLYKAIVERKHYYPSFHYISDETNGNPYLLGYRFVPSPGSQNIAGILGFQIDLAKLSQQLFPIIHEKLDIGNKVALEILSSRGEFVLGSKMTSTNPIAMAALKEPFDFWQVAIYVPGADMPNGFDFRTTIGWWFVGLLMLSIFIGAFIFIRRAWRESFISRMKSSFVSNVSHELRTPLASIKMLAELIEFQLMNNSDSEKELQTRIKNYIQVITRECNRLGRLIENLLSFSKIERGVKQYNLEYEDTATVLQMAVEAFRPHAEAEGFTVEVDIDPDLPEVKMDADAISQVMLNLLSNAMKYSDTIKKVSIRARKIGQNIVVEVSDYGVGIAPNELSRIFDDFYQVDRRLNSLKPGGMGLGLTLVQHIIKAHGGDIKVQSKLGEGSSFIFTIPLPEIELPHNLPQTELNIK